MFWLVLLCGWALTAATIALVWNSSRPKRTMAGGLVLGALAGLLWPISFWVAIGALLGRFAARRSGRGSTGSGDVQGQIQQADALARQAELEGMTGSAAYWRAEVQRLDTQPRGSDQPAVRPAWTTAIVLGCTVAALVTVGILAFPLGGVTSAQALAGRSGPMQPSPPTDVSPTTEVAPSATSVAPPSRFDRVPADLVAHWRGTIGNSTKSVADITIDQADLQQPVGRLTLEGSDLSCTFTTSLLDAGPTFVEFDIAVVESTQVGYCDDSGSVRLDTVNGDTTRVKYSYSGSDRGFLDRYAS